MKHSNAKRKLERVEPVEDEDKMDSKYCLTSQVEKHQDISFIDRFD